MFDLKLCKVTDFFKKIIKMTLEISLLYEVSRPRTHFCMPLQLYQNQYLLYRVKLFEVRTSPIGISAFSIFNNPES
ncbi:MAG: hypothetical protein ACI8QP_001772 [Porticoccaceae bacterium]|jgi:hypothetical protein